MKTKTEEKRQTETLRMKTELCLNMKEIWLNNAGVVSVGHGIEPPGVSHRPIGPSARLAAQPRGRDGDQRTDTERSFLSHILLHQRASFGLPMSLYTPGSSLFTDRHAGKFQHQTDSDWPVW